MSNEALAFDIADTIVVSTEYQVFEGTPEEVAEFKRILEDYYWEKALWEYIDPKGE